MHARDTILHIQQHIIITKAHVKFQLNQFKIFRGKVTKVNNGVNYAYIKPNDAHIKPNYAYHRQYLY